MSGPVAAVRAESLVRHHGRVVALDGIDVTLRAGAVHGLLGSNGAGKTTLLQLVAGQILPTSGRVQVFGRAPFEDAAALSQLCLVRENQRYPDGYRVKHVLRAAGLLLPHWDAAYAARLMADFDLPPDRPTAKLSRGMQSALGIVVGLASRAPLTLFDEPYLGLDATSRERFYDRLLADVAERPRTVVLSTHLIDEVADLLEYVVVLAHGRVVAAGDTDRLRQEAVTLTGPADQVEAAVCASSVLARERLGSVARVVARRDGLRPGAGDGLHAEPVTLQRLVVHLTSAPPDRPAEPAATTSGATQ